MVQEYGIPTGFDLPEELRRKGQRSLIHIAETLTSGGILLGGNIATLFLMTLGAAPLHIGIMAMMIRLAHVGQLGGLAILPRTGKAKLLSWGKFMAAVPVIGLVAVALTGRVGTAYIMAAIAAYSLHELIHFGAHASWWPLIQENTVGDARGAFLARLRFRLRFIEIGLPLALGWYIGKEANTPRFALPFAGGMLMLLLGGWLSRTVPEADAPIVREGIFTRLRGAIAEKSVRRLAVFNMQYFFIAAFATPFWVVILRERGLPQSRIVYLVTVIALGHVIGLKMWARLVDTHGGRSTLSITIVGQALPGLAWLFLPASPLGLTIWAVIYFMIWGFMEGGLLMGRTWAMLASVPAAHKTEGFTVLTLAIALSGSVGSLLGGLMYQWLGSVDTKVLGLEPLLIYLSAIQLCILLTWFAKRKIAGHDRQTPARLLWSGLIKRWFLIRRI